MKIALVPNPTICSHCGENWAAPLSEGHALFVSGKMKYCPKCGATASHRFDPLVGQSSFSGQSVVCVNNQAKFVIRFGVLGMGFISLLTGVLLCVAGWGGAHHELDLVQLWVARIGGPLLVGQGHCMKRSAKRLKEYDKIDFDPKEIIAGMSRLKGARRRPTSIALEDELIKELQGIAKERGIPYQVLMRLLIADGVRRIKKAA